MGVGGTAILAAINPTVAALGLANIGLYGQADRNFKSEIITRKIKAVFRAREKFHIYPNEAKTLAKHSSWSNCRCNTASDGLHSCVWWIFWY